MHTAKQNDGALVRVNDVEKVFHRGSEEIHVLTGLNLDVPRGEFLALMGPSGSGKSTLLNLIGGLDRATRGTVQVGGEPIDRMSDRELAAWRARHVGLVFQFYNLLPVLSAPRSVGGVIICVGFLRARAGGLQGYGLLDGLPFDEER